MEAFKMDSKQYPNQEQNCHDGLPAGRDVQTDPVGYGNSPSREPLQNAGRRTYGERRMLKGAAGRAATDADRAQTYGEQNAQRRVSSDRDGIADPFGNSAPQGMHFREEDHTEYSSGRPEIPGSHFAGGEDAEHRANPPKAAGRPVNSQKKPSETLPEFEAVDGDAGAQSKTQKKKRSRFNAVGILMFFLPWRGDSVFEAVRKIIFSTALVVVGICTFLISSYYIDLYKAKQEYQEIQRQLEETRANRSFKTESYTEDPQTGEMFEYLEYNDIANKLLSQNPDLVGYIKVPGTLVSYPVVQKKSKDVTVNMNDYYLYRTFHQEDSKSGCIFMDYRCHFDEVFEHRRVVDNSGNIFIYGHNMNNRTMFGSLRDYVSNPYFYSEHPIVELSSCYNDYVYKIFSIFIVDGEDYESEYAFDCWNTLEFPDEETFYWYVNEAKKRTTVNTNVDVEYGDPILSLYTCNGLCPNAKLILMCRQVRAGEDPYEGTENATLNENVLYPSAYYKNGRPVNYDPSKFVPYGPKS